MISEAQIVNKLIEVILSKGHSITLAAEGEEFFGPSLDKDELISNSNASDMITIYFPGGFFLIIWGNGNDIISDHSDNAICEAINAEVNHALGL